MRSFPFDRLPPEHGCNRGGVLADRIASFQQPIGPEDQCLGRRQTASDRGGRARRRHFASSQKTSIARRHRARGSLVVFTTSAANPSRV